MGKNEKRQALAVSARLCANGDSLPAVQRTAFAELEAEIAATIAADSTQRASAGTSGHIVVDQGQLSGFVRDGHTLVRFGGGSIAVTTMD